MSSSRKRFRKSVKATSRKRTFTGPRRPAYAPLGTNFQGTNPQSMAVFRGIGFPDKLRIRTQWSDDFKLSGFGVVTTATQGAQMNNPYDPDPALGGGQPTYFDACALVYNNYKVVGSKITVKFAVPNNTGVTNEGPYQVGILGSSTSGIPTTDPGFLSTAPNSVCDLLTGDQTKTLTQTYSSEFFNDNPAGTEAAVNANPSLRYYANVWASPRGGGGNTGYVVAYVTIEYLIEFFNLKPVIDL